MKAAWEPTLAGFTVTNTARDLGELIAAVRQPGEPVAIYAVSYGPYLVNRYLQLYPDQPSAVVLDSICGPGKCSFTTQDARFDAVAHVYFDACKADGFCAQRLGTDPWGRFGTVLDSLDAGGCPQARAAGLTRASLRNGFAELMYDWSARTLVPALVHRLDRCGVQDAPVFARFGALLSAPATEASLEHQSVALAYHIGLSELWDEPSPSVAEFEAAKATQYISNSIGVRLARLHDRWPRVPHDAYYGAWATSSVPMLMLGGSLDPATPLAYEDGAMAAFHGPHQTFVTIPNATHGVLLASPTTTGVTCGVTLVTSFLADATAPVDTSCVASVLPLVFDTSPLSEPYFGTSDLWGDGA
jgi:pimeloyl-ACP methyl ester carboxylesterase